jgi:hypothetical protein
MQSMSAGSKAQLGSHIVAATSGSQASLPPVEPLSPPSVVVVVSSPESPSSQATAPSERPRAKVVEVSL